MTLTKEKFFQQIDSLIRSEGFAYICIGPDVHGPSFAYTVGLTETYGCPELLIFGVGEQIANVVFHSIVGKIKNGERFADGDVMNDVLNLPCAVRDVSAGAARPFALNVWSRYEGALQTPRFQQVVYPDRASVFPWESGYDEAMRQIQKELWTAER